MELTALEKVKTGFPPEIPFPAILEKLIIWDETENPEPTPMGYFEFNEYGRDAWMHPVNEAGLKRLAQFGLSPDGGQFCLWAKEDGTMPVVYLGTGQGAKIVAKNLEDFIILLAIGYPNIESADMSLSPMACYEKYDKPYGSDKPEINRHFQKWVRENLKTTIPRTGEKITDAATNDKEEIYNWLKINTSDPTFY